MNHPAGQGFQLNGDGQIVPMGESAGTAGTIAAPLPALAFVESLRAQAQPVPAQQPASARPPFQGESPKRKPKSLVAQARARIAELKRELKRADALKKELHELERLVRAAKEKPCAEVRSLSARRTG